MKKPVDVDSYIHACSTQAQPMLHALRAIIVAAAPQAEEGIGYGMPMYRLDGPLVYFAAQAKHLGFYPGAVLGAGTFAKLEEYQTSKGTLQFPYGTKLPVRLVQQIVKARVAQNQARTAARHRPKATTRRAKPRGAAARPVKNPSAQTKPAAKKAAAAKKPRPQR